MGWICVSVSVYVYHERKNKLKSNQAHISLPTAHDCSVISAPNFQPPPPPVFHTRWASPVKRIDRNRGTPRADVARLSHRNSQVLPRSRSLARSHAPTTPTPETGLVSSIHDCTRGQTEPVELVTAGVFGRRTEQTGDGGQFFFLVGCWPKFF
jgi:hypothetical protein